MTIIIEEELKTLTIEEALKRLGNTKEEVEQKLKPYAKGGHVGYGNPRGCSLFCYLTSFGFPIHSVGPTYIIFKKITEDEEHHYHPLPQYINQGAKRAHGIFSPPRYPDPLPS